MHLEDTARTTILAMDSVGARTPERSDVVIEGKAAGTGDREEAAAVDAEIIGIAEALEVGAERRRAAGDDQDASRAGGEGPSTESLPATAAAPAQGAAPSSVSTPDASAPVNHRRLVACNHGYFKRTGIEGFLPTGFLLVSRARASHL